MQYIIVCICLFVLSECVNGQSIIARSNATLIRNGETIDFSFVGYNLIEGMSLLDITGGYFTPGSLDMVPLTLWDITTSRLVLYQNLAGSPSFIGRASVPHPKVMRISNFTFNEQGYRFAFSMSYKVNSLSRRKTSQIFTVQVADFYGISVNVTSNMTISERSAIPSVSCTASGVPTPTIHWIKDGSLLSSSSSLQITHDIPAEHTNRSIVSFTNDAIMHRGSYTCFSINPLENATLSFELLIKSAPGNVSVSVRCFDSSQRICWHSIDDTVDSQADTYHVTSSDGWRQMFPATTKCLNSLYDNASASFNLTITASNQYGMSPTRTETVQLTDICSGTVPLVWSRVSLVLLLMFSSIGYLNLYSYIH